MMKRVLPIFLRVLGGKVWAQQEQGPDKIAGSEQFSKNSYSYIEGKGRGLIESPRYMAGKKHYLSSEIRTSFGLMKLSKLFLANVNAFWCGTLLLSELTNL